MNAPSGEAQPALARLIEIAERIAALEADVYRLRLEQQRLRAELDVTGYQPGERQEELL